jgi:hypothetical protein
MIEVFDMGDLLVLPIQEALDSDVTIEPFVGHEGEVHADKAAVEVVAADPAPRGVMIRAAGVEAGAGDVE